MPKMAKKWLENSPEDVYRLRMATLGEVCFLHFFSPIALNGTCVGLRWIQNTDFNIFKNKYRNLTIK